MQSVAAVAHRATGAWPVCSPPFTAETLPVQLFEHVDLIWLGLHGVETNPDFLYGDETNIPGMSIASRIRALHVDSLRGLDLRGKVVFATSCYLPATNFPDAFKQAGATVVGGPGQNYGNKRRLVGADKLGAALVGAMRTTSDLLDALNFAKLVLNNTRADIDAKGFGIL